MPIPHAPAAARVRPRSSSGPHAIAVHEVDDAVFSRVGFTLQQRARQPFSTMTLEFFLRLLTAFACGVAIGLERQMRQRTAGLRTITLVASGACLFVTLGVLTGNGVSGITQIAAYVVSGAGFLGGGVIMRDKGSIQGSTPRRRCGARRPSAY